MNIVEQTDGNVDSNRTPQENKCEVIAASAQSKGASGSNLIKSPSKQLKEEISFSRLLQLDGHQLKKSGKRLGCLCPFHNERTPSFFISEDDTTGSCFGQCGWYGDIFEYEMKKRKVGFFEALQKLQKKRDKVLRDSPVNLDNYSKKPKLEHRLSNDEHKLMEVAAQRLSDDAWLCGYIAKPRGWQPETIQNLAKEGSLGWHRGALAFLYPTGMKVRAWPKKIIEWEFGTQTIWRRDRMEMAQHVFVTEGETDSISLLDAGIEEDAGVAVVCVPGASAFQKAWCPIFTGKAVTLCFDNDGAGEKGARITADFLRPYAKEIFAVNFGEVGNE
jgi:hypothetical protein